MFGQILMKTYPCDSNEDPMHQPALCNKSANSSSLTSDDSPNELPEKEEYQIELRKDTNGLGITIAGYVCEKGKMAYPIFCKIMLYSAIFCDILQCSVIFCGI